MQKASSDFSLAQRFITAGAAAWGDDDDDYDALASVSILGGAASPPRRLTASRSVPDVPRSSTPLEHVAADFPWNANIFSLTASPVAALLAPEPPLASPTPPPRSLPPLDRAWHRQPASRVADATSQAKAHKPSLEARGRAFRFVLAHVEVDVVAPTVAVREHWLLACRSLPLGGAFVGRVSVATAYEEAGSPGARMRE